MRDRILAALRGPWLHLFVAMLVAGCDCAPPLPDRCVSNVDCPAGEVCRDGLCVPRLDVDAAPSSDAPFPDAPPRLVPEALIVEPSSIELVLRPGEERTVLLTATTRWSDGVVRPATAPMLALDNRLIGRVEHTGAFTSFGRIGGAGTLSIAADGFTATIPVTVRLEEIVYGTGLDASVSTRFEGVVAPDTGDATQIVYPLEGAVMPQNVFPADVQWLSGATGDVFRVRLSKEYASVTAYVLEDGLHHFLPEIPAWRAVVQTDAEDALLIEVTRWESSGSRLTASAPVHVRFARAALTGSVYYWDIEAGRVLRIDDGTGSRVNFMPTPPTGIYGFDCVGCHTISPSGRYMAGRLDGGDNIGAIFDLTTDLTGSPPPTTWPISTAPPSALWWFSSWSPDETRLITSQEPYRSMRFLNATDGTWVDVTSAEPLPANATQPAWSPDGASIAYVSDTEWQGTDNLRGNLSILPVTGPDTIGPSRLVHRAADIGDGGLSDSYPTWTPDSAHLAFGHGLDARSERGSCALYTIQPDGTQLTRLDAAMGGASRLDNFQPRFSPFHQGGYYWLSFLSRRDYGNSEVGTRGTGRQQIWVSAIRDDVVGTGADPSSVGYWLPGQATTSRNISAYWAPRACRPDGETCAVGSECCGGECVPGAGGIAVCSPPPEERCRQDGETCFRDSDCCAGRELSCYANVCVQAPI